MIVVMGSYQFCQVSGVVLWFRYSVDMFTCGLHALFLPLHHRLLWLRAAEKLAWFDGAPRLTCAAAADLP
jgi:hypothetical protein